MKNVLDLLKETAAELAVFPAQVITPRIAALKASVAACISNAEAELKDILAKAPPAPAGEETPDETPKAKGKAAKVASVVLALAALAFALFCGATASADSFYVTNVLSSTNTISGYPTNSIGTNGLPRGTGSTINVVNQEWAGFYFQAYVVTNVGNATSNLVVTLLRGWGQNPPQSTLSVATNVYSGGQTVLSYSEFEHPTNSGLITLTIPIPGTNYITWFTNLDRYQIGGANYVGVWSIAPGGTNWCLTNVAMGLNKKIIPIRYP